MLENDIVLQKQATNNLLRRDVRFLGHILGEVLVHQGGNDLLDIVERIREMSKSLRAHYVIEIYDEFKKTISFLRSGNSSSGDSRIRYLLPISEYC